MKLPKYTTEQVRWITFPYYPYYPLTFFKELFPERHITARDVLKVPARKFKHKANTFSSNGLIKVILAYWLMPVSLRTAWDTYSFAHGSSADIKRGLKLCDEYERGEI